MTERILEQIREPFLIKEVERNYPFLYEESMNSVLLQELARYNKLIETIRSSLRTLLKTLEGKVTASAEMDELFSAMKNNTIPQLFKKKSYPSNKPLQGYIDDLRRRLQSYETWIERGKPSCFWISGFFFTQSFLTGVKQNFARKYQFPIDKIDFQYRVLKFADEKMVMSTPAPEGCYLNGFFLEGAAWDDERCTLRESDPKILHVPVPPMQFIPVNTAVGNDASASATPLDHTIDESSAATPERSNSVELT